MEETLEHDEGTDDEMSRDAGTGTGKFTPLHAHVEEVLDELTLECFSSTVAPMVSIVGGSLIYDATISSLTVLLVVLSVDLFLQDYAGKATTDCPNCS